MRLGKGWVSAMARHSKRERLSIRSLKREVWCRGVPTPVSPVYRGVGLISSHANRLEAATQPPSPGVPATSCDDQDCNYTTGEESDATGERTAAVREESCCPSNLGRSGNPQPKSRGVESTVLTLGVAEDHLIDWE